MQKGISTFFAILVVGIIAIIGFTILYSYQYIWAPEEKLISQKEASEEGIFIPDDWETYRNEEFGYSISYPEKKFTLNIVNNSVIESDTRDTGELIP